MLAPQTFVLSVHPWFCEPQTHPTGEFLVRSRPFQLKKLMRNKKSMGNTGHIRHEFVALTERRTSAERPMCCITRAHHDALHGLWLKTTVTCRASLLATKFYVGAGNKMWSPTKKSQNPVVRYDVGLLKHRKFQSCKDVIFKIPYRS